MQSQIIVQSTRRLALLRRAVVVSHRAAAAPTTTTTTCHQFFSSEPAPQQEETSPTPLSSEKLQGLYDKVTALPPEEVNILGALVIQVLGKSIFPGEFGGGAGAGVAAAGAGGEAAAEDAPAEKTLFDVKLSGFDAKAKIKVIKEVRAIAGLGLKEAKELVESAPKVITKDLSQEKADELKAQLEAVGATIEIV